MFNIAQNGVGIDSIQDAEVRSMLARAGNNPLNLVPQFNLSANEAAIIERVADLPQGQLEAERRNLIATNDDAHGYDIYRTVMDAVLMPLQDPATFTGAVNRLAPINGSIPWYTRLMSWNRSDFMQDAHNTGSPQTAGTKDKPQLDQDEMFLPFQIVHAGGVDPSTVAQSRAAGIPIDTRFATLAGQSIVRLNEKNSLGTGSSGNKYYGNLSNYGVYDDPNVKTGSLHAAWDTTTTPEKINDDTADMLAEMHDPTNVIITVGEDYQGVLNKFINPQANNTRVRNTLLEIMGVEKVISSRYAPGAKVSATSANALEVINQLDIVAVPYGGYNGSEWGTQNWVFFIVRNIRHNTDKNGELDIVIYSE